MSVKESYEVEVKARLEGLNAQIETMAEELDQVSSEVKSEYKDRIELLRNRRQELQEQLQNIQATSDAAWMQLREGLDEALTMFSEAVEDARDEFRQAWEKSTT